MSKYIANMTGRLPSTVHGAGLLFGEYSACEEKMVKKKYVAVLGAMLLFSGSVNAEIKVVPLLNADFGFGSSTFEGKSASNGTNLNLDVCPVLRFNDKTSLLPRFNFSYSGIMLATEITDYGNLYQQLQDTLLNVKLVHKLGEANSGKLRLELGLKNEKANEALNETWGTGLYDYNNTFTTFGYEKRIKNTTFEIGYRISNFKFPNYTTISTDTSKIAGKYTLDNDLGRLFLNIGFSFVRNPEKPAFLDLSLASDSVNYPDQKIALAAGGYSTDKRKDAITDFNVRLALNKLKENRDSTLGFKLGSKTKTSNQHNWDADVPLYTENYFNYSEISFEPYIVMKYHPKDWILSLSYNWATRNYANRLAYDLDGVPTDDKMYLRTGTFSLGVNYPLGRKFELVFSLMSGSSSSNMLYETYYKYNFKTSNTFLGINYEL